MLIQTTAKTLASEIQGRLDSVKAAAAVPEACGPAIAPAPARGGFVLVQNVELIPVGADDVAAVHRGYGGRHAIRRADAFDAMLAAAARRKQPAPLTHGQISIGRRYHDLVQLLSADGTKLSSLQASAGGPDGRDWMDRRLEVSAEVDRLRRRIGQGAALVLRRVRPSQRGRVLQPGDRGPLTFTRRDLVDCVCLRGMSIKQVLAKWEWQTNGRNCNAAIAALGEALDAMMGYRGQKSS
ncbi:hypothetical protein [Paracoccus sp. ME4]|uniref:hypothetical protein n=1 Tax=Paracoccus sp. ME4 TaxID=3138066 RepID=UPI00398B2694